MEGRKSEESFARLSLLFSHLSPSLSPPPPGDRLLRRQPSMASDEGAPSDSYTIFDKIIKKEIPAKVVFEDDEVLAFRDIDPQASTHILIIPKVRDGLTGISQAEERHCHILGRLMYTVKLVAKQEGLDDGYRVVINEGADAGQTVFHLHIHVIGGRQMKWPPG